MLIILNIYIKYMSFEQINTNNINNNSYLIKKNKKQKLCHHKRLQYYCKECGGKSICPHKRRKKSMYIMRRCLYLSS